MFELAQTFNATVLFVEHRYYGQTLPFGRDSFSDENLGYLTLEQALADYAAFIVDYKNNVAKCSKCPIVTFGGSYGAMLVAWFRLKYPWLTVGGVPSSASVNFYPYRGQQEDMWNHIMDAYKNYGDGDNCDQKVKNVLNYVYEVS
eukprot:UN33734